MSAPAFVLWREPRPIVGPAMRSRSLGAVDELGLDVVRRLRECLLGRHLPGQDALDIGTVVGHGLVVPGGIVVVAGDGLDGTHGHLPQVLAAQAGYILEELV